MAEDFFGEPKFNRLLRRCGVTEEQCINSSYICMINVTAVGCATLTNLVEMGIGGFTIIDSGIVTEYDKGTNYFLQDCKLGEKRGTACVKILLKMNKNVRGNFMIESFEDIIEKNPDYFKQFHAVLAANLSEKRIISLSQKLWDDEVPLVYCRSLGFFATTRIQAKYQVYFNNVPDAQMYDFRLHKPFPALQDFLESTYPNSSVPWIVLMAKYLKDWQKKHNGSRMVPITNEEKQELANLIMETHKSKDPAAEHTIKAIDIAFNYTGEITKNINMIFEILDKIEGESLKDTFWILMRSLKSFSKSSNKGMLPVNGHLPEMHVNSKVNMAIRNIYEHQSLQDANDIFEKCLSKLRSFNLSSRYIQYETVLGLCKQLAKLGIQKGREIPLEYLRMPFYVDDCLDDDEFKHCISGPQFYLAFRTYEKFLDKYGRPPMPDNITNEAKLFRDIAEGFLDAWRVRTDINEEVIYEVCHYRGGELKCIATEIAKVASDNIKKILTNQEVDLHQTYLYNGIKYQMEYFNL